MAIRCKNPDRKPGEPCGYVACRWHMFDIIKGDMSKTDDELADIALSLPVACMWDKWEYGKCYSPAEIGRWFRMTGNNISNMRRELLLKPTKLRRHLRVVHDTFHNPDYDAYEERVSGTPRPEAANLGVVCPGHRRDHWIVRERDRAPAQATGRRATGVKQGAGRGEQGPEPVAPGHDGANESGGS